jgi:hypothetical protein
MPKLGVQSRPAITCKQTDMCRALQLSPLSANGWSRPSSIYTALSPWLASARTPFPAPHSSRAPYSPGRAAVPFDAPAVFLSGQAFRDSSFAFLWSASALGRRSFSPSVQVIFLSIFFFPWKCRSAAPPLSSAVRDGLEVEEDPL